MDIINLRHDVLGETEYRKTLCTFLVFVSTCRSPHHLGRKGSKSNNGTRKKSKKNLNETKDMIKHLPGEQLAAVKKEGK